MAGKREKANGRTRLPGIVALLAVAAVVLTSAGPAGAAADSPVERITAQLLPAAEHTPEMPAAEQPQKQPEEADVPAEPVKQPFAPVAESAPVEDAYFDDVVFLGDSRTEGFHLYSGLKTGTYFYAVGATVESVFTKKAWETPKGKVPLLDAVAAAPCGKVYVMLGVNELGWARTETFRDQCAKVIDRIREDHPGAEVVLQSILPVSAKQDAKGSYVNNGRIAAYNQVLLALAEEKECPYINVAEAVADESGCLRADWTFDGVHLNVTGCQAWLEYLRTHPVEQAEAGAEAGGTADAA